MDKIEEIRKGYYSSGKEGAIHFFANTIPQPITFFRRYTCTGEILGY